MKSFKIIVLLGFLVSSLSFSAVSLKAEKSEKEELPQAGLISGSKSGGFGATNIDGPWGGINSDGKESSPISGSVSSVGNGYWVAKIYNNSEDSYRASMSILEFDNLNKQVYSKQISVSLKGGEKVERKFRASPRTAHAALKLNKWTKKEKKSSQSELLEEIKQKEKELKELRAKAGISKQ